MAHSDQSLNDTVAEGACHASLKTAAWVSVALGALALGVVLGREIRSRYKFKRRTPYDYYAHAGDDRSDFAEFGYGV
jgi:hypothetical protein